MWNNGAQNQNLFGSSQNNQPQGQNNQLGNLWNNGAKNQVFYGSNSNKSGFEPIIDPIYIPKTTSSSVEKLSSGIPVYTIEPPKENYSKSFDPYFGMTTRAIPKTPQNYWFSRYYGFTGPIAAIPFSNYNRI